MRHDDPRLEPADLLRGHAEQHEVGVVMVKTAVTVHHVGARRTSFWLHLGSLSCQKKCVKKCHRVNPERTTLHVSQIQVPRDNDLQNLPSPRDDTSDEVPKLQFKIRSVRGLVNANSAPAHPKAHHDRTTGRTKHSRVVPNASKHCDH